MSYYLVNHTSLVEGEDEIQEAHKVLAKLQSGEPARFAVKFDDEKVTRVTVSKVFDSTGLALVQASDLSSLERDLTRSSVGSEGKQLQYSYATGTDRELHDLPAAGFVDTELRCFQ
ncbi:MAG: hypothetical protein ACT6U0_09260 [Shinella sp.]|uniref:hypothetical protein n=1 Tax=Shinella sp. TaxID=1870904 RepID=UPI00403599A3